MTHLWNFIQSMSLSNRNKQWLADRLIESKVPTTRKASTPSLEERLEQGRKEIREGECSTCQSKEELTAFLEAL